MKKSLFFGLVAILGLIGCSRNQEIDVPEANLSLFARTESPADTKTVVESGVHVYWEPGDEIAVFLGEKSAKFTTDITAASGTATFKGTFGNQGWPEELDLWAVYPYSEDAVFDGETITTTLPSEQVAREGSFGKDMNLSIAHSTGTTLQFYNVGGGIRFSVTQEGIKKVMFEGLSGEIISGKVKIGMDENGKPVVKEVTGGSQFITLLPPSGQESFKPGVWYYIVAIPGSLEGGYKLRFYKDSDYARKESVKDATIKRSIFGNIEKADEGIEYEATTTHFPETEEEWEKSCQQTNIIKDSWDFIATDKLMYSDSLDAESVVKEIERIEGVSDVTSNGTTVIVTQKDGIKINIFLEAYNKKAYTDSERSQSTVSASLRAVSSAKSVQETFNDGKQALILAPFANAGLNGVLLPEKLTSLHQAFVDMGFSKVTVLRDDEAGIEQFYGEFLSQYDVIIFSTHGGIGVHDTVEGTTISTTTVASSTKYNPESFRMCSKYAPAICFLPRQTFKQFIKDIFNLGVESDAFLCMTPSFLDGIDNDAFKNAWIHFESCHSADIDEAGERPMMKAFVDKGASAVSGYYGDIHTKVIANPMTLDLIADLGGGLSFMDSYNLENTGVRKNMCHPWIVDSPYYLVNPYPTNLNKKVISDNEIELSWTQAPNLGTYSYDVYLNGELIKTTYNKSVKYNGSLRKDNTWYVVANLLEFNLFSTKTWASYQSQEEHFTMPESSDEVTIISSTYGEKSYSVIRKDVSMSDFRINGDNSRFYPCSFCVKENDKVYELPGSYYSYQDHRPDTDLGPIMAVDTRTGGMHVFFIEKDDYQPDKYSMRGHMFTILDGAISEQTIFTSDNFGWFPYFTWDAHQLVLNCFSFDQYFSITAAQFDNWALQKGGKIQPGDFSARQKANDLILFYETATPWEGEIVLEREYKVWSSGDYSTSWEGKTSANYAYPTIALVFDNDQSISIGYYNTYYWTSRSDRVFGIYIITGGQEQYVQARIVDEWVKEKFVINGKGVVRYYTNDVFMGEWTFYLDLASAHRVSVVGNPFGWWYTHYHYMDDFSLRTPATSVSDNFNDGEIDLTVWEQPVNPDGVYEEDGYLHMIQKRTDEDFTIRSKSILIVN